MMDFTLRFHHAVLNAFAVYLPAYITFMGIYELTRVPFGPRNAPIWCQQLMAGVVLAGILYLICAIYVNDCIVYNTVILQIYGMICRVIELIPRFGINHKCATGFATREDKELSLVLSITL